MLTQAPFLLKPIFLTEDIVINLIKARFGDIKFHFFRDAYINSLGDLIPSTCKLNALFTFLFDGLVS